MVRALPVTAFQLPEFFERLRPGMAISLALHAGLLLALAYFLAFKPSAPPVPDTTEVLTVVDIPPPPPLKPVTVDASKFQPMKTRDIIGLKTEVPPFVLPPVDSSDRQPTTQTATEPTPDVVINPQPLYRGGLEFPERAADAGRSGYVDFTFTIEPDGSVGDAQIVSEVPPGYGFATAARKAFATWRFKPMTRNGRAVAASARIRVSFELK